MYRLVMFRDSRDNVVSSYTPYSQLLTINVRQQKIGGMAEWLCSGLQIRLSRFDSGFRLQIAFTKAIAPGLTTEPFKPGW